MDVRKVLFRGVYNSEDFTIEELLYDGRSARVYFGSENRAAQSGIPLDGNPRMLFDYNQRFLELSLYLRPKSVLILGGGMMTLPMALIDALPEINITAVEKNENLINLAAEYFDYQPSEHLKIVIGDAYDHMQKISVPTYDLIIVDLYDNLMIPKVFRGLSFAEKLQRSLFKDGVVAANCIASLSGDNSKPMRQLVAAYSKQIGLTTIYPAGDNTSFLFPQNLIILAVNGSAKKYNCFDSIKEIAKPEIVSTDYLR